MSTTEDFNRAVSIAREYDYFDPAYREDGENALLDFLRTHTPAMFSARANRWTLLRYDDVREAFESSELFLNDTTVSDERADDGGFFENVTKVCPEHVDPPEHRKYRKGLNALFTPAAVRGLEPELRAAAAGLAEGIAQRGEGDLVWDYAVPFPTMAFCHLMGFPTEDYADLMRWSDIYMHGASTRVGRHLDEADLNENGRAKPDSIVRLVRETSDTIVAYLDRIFDERRRDPRDDLMTRLLELRYDDERPLRRDELNSIAFNLYLGGLDTTSNVLAMALHDFAVHPEHRQAFMAIMDDPKTLDLAVSELVRIHAPVNIPRRVKHDAEFRGLQLRQDDIVNLDTTAANHDPTKFACPREPAFDRQPNPHLGFGHGRHRCLGIHLAKLELGIGLQELLRRLPAYAIPPEASVQVGVGVVRGLDSLPVVVHP
jgi:cytochrome P450